ncbi:MAG: hypothetical protein ACK4EX_08355 [Thermaurantimonas sp.]|uniref:hypothetical protein n=1 Tax=Thermaurantimonas sp. TaxID=2681568 RepID=UPI003919E5CC
MKKNVLVMAVVALLTVTGCKKGEQNLTKETTSPTFRLIGGGGYEFGTFNKEKCEESGGDINKCCPPPAAECCKCPVDVPASHYNIVLDPLNGNNPYEVAEFFLNSDWQTFFPQLIGEDDLLSDLRNGYYTLEKTIAGNKVYCTFQSNADKLTLIITLI